MFTFYRALVHTICRIKWQAWSQCRLAQSLNLLKYSNLHRRWQNQEKHQQASASTLEWEVVRHLPQWNQLRKQWKVHHPKSQKQNNSSQHSGTVYVLRVDYTVFRSGWALWVYTAARGNPNTYLHMSFFFDNLFLQMHIMIFWRYNYQYFTDPSCNFMPNHIQLGIWK